MFKFKKQIEAQLQEIVFFFSLLIAFSLFISGVFYLTLSEASLIFILGQFGALIDKSLFSIFGYGFFYFAVAALHFGYITNFHIFSFKDFKREWPVLALAGLAHLIILALFSNLLSIMQIYLEISSSSSLAYGSGGWIGLTFGSGIYAALGVYGSIVALVLTMAVTALIANFFELNEVLDISKKASIRAKALFLKSAKQLNSALSNGLQFLLKGGGEFSEVAASSANIGRWASSSASKAKHLLTDHFHIYKREEDYIAKKEDEKEAVAKKTKSASGKNLMTDLSRKKINVMKKSSTKKTTSKNKAKKK